MTMRVTRPVTMTGRHCVPAFATPLGVLGTIADCDLLGLHTCKGVTMTRLAVSLLVGAASLFVSVAQSAPLTNGTPSIGNGAENVRMVCNENGRCWRERRVIL